jgi:hypothetical protein
LFIHILIDYAAKEYYSKLGNRKSKAQRKPDNDVSEFFPSDYLESAKDEYF